MMKKNFFKMVSIDGVKGLFLGAIGAAVSTTPLAGGMKKAPMVDMLDAEANDAETSDAEVVTEATAAQTTMAAAPKAAAPRVATVTSKSEEDVVETEEAIEENTVNVTIEDGGLADDDVEIVELEDIDNFELDADIFAAPTVSAGLPEDIIPYQVDEQVPTATSVDYAMSFKEALVAAREEVGEAGVFEWHGNLFATFYEENWDKMTDDEKEAFVGHIQWIDDDGIHFDFLEEPVNVQHADNAIPTDSEITVDYVTVELDDVEAEEELFEDITLEDIKEEDLDSEVEILGFSTSEDEAEVIGMDVDGDDVMLVDISDDTDPGMGIDDIMDAALETVEPEIINDDTSIDTTTTDDFTLV